MRSLARRTVAAGTALALLAAVAITRARSRWWPHLVATALLSQAVRIHPAPWVPMATVPLCTLVTSGTHREQALSLGRALLTIGVVGAGRDLRTRPLDVTDPPPDLRAFGPGTWYYRSSLCASPPARAWCDALERAHQLRPAFTAELPAVPSMRHLTYATPTVRIGLYQVTD